MRSQEGNIQDSESMNRGGGPSSSHVSIIHNIRINPRSVFTIPRVALELFSIFYLEEIRDISLSLSLSERSKKALRAERRSARDRVEGGIFTLLGARIKALLLLSKAPTWLNLIIIVSFTPSHTVPVCDAHVPFPPSSSSPSPRLLRRDLRGSLQQRMRAHCVGRDYARACWCVYAPRLGSANHGLTVYSIRGKLNIPTSSGTPKRLFSTLRNGRPRVRLWPQRATM